MVNFTDFKGYNSVNGPGLGGSIDTTKQISPATPNNLFSNVSRTDLINGATIYQGMYFKNTSAEPMDNVKIWISSGTPLPYTAIDFGFDDTANPYRGAIDLDGTNDYINCGNHTNLWSKSLNKFSFSFWIYPQAAGDGFYRGIIDHGAGANGSFACYIDNDVAGRIVFKIVDSSGNFHLVGCDDIVLNVWQHIICSYDSTLVGGGNVRIYRNGVRSTDYEFDTTFTGSINISSDLIIGGGSNDFDGLVRDFKFWDAQSINTSEATQLYNDSLNGTDTFQSDPSYHLQCNERTGNPRDKVSLTKTGILTNGASWKLSIGFITNKYTQPANVTWFGSGTIPKGIGRLSAGEYFPIWVRITIDPDSPTQPVIDDNGIFTINFDTVDTDSTGTPGTGGGTGGQTPSTSVSNYKIAFAGDWGCESETDDVVDLIDDNDYDLVVGVGDNAYEGASCWTSRFNRFKSKMISAYGNHEYEESGGTSPYKSFFGDSSSSSRGGIVYTHRFQNILFLIMDTNDDKGGVSLDNQRTFFRNELEKYKNDSRVVWRIAICHHPWFGDGGRHPENEFDQVQKFHKLFTDYDVNFVYHGHNHNWHRSHQVSYDSSNPEEPNLVDSSSPYSRSGNGLIAICSGMGGHDDPSSSYDLPDDANFWAYRNKSNNGIHELVASNNGKTLTGRFRNTNGTTFDTFVINA